MYALSGVVTMYALSGVVTMYALSGVVTMVTSISRSSSTMKNNGPANNKIYTAIHHGLRY